MIKLQETNADKKIRECLDSNRSFAVIAGAGSGKTTSLVTALKYLREFKGAELRKADQNIVCITYTNRAVDVISQRLEWDDLFKVSTIHSFLWGSVKRFSKDIRVALQTVIIPQQIEKKRQEDDGGKSKKAVSARERIDELQQQICMLNEVDRFEYNDSNFSDYPEGLLGHDDIIRVSTCLIRNNAILRRIVGKKFPYIFVDEAQDTFPEVIDALNALNCDSDPPLIGYFGDPMQQIYDKRAGDFANSVSTVITKEENFRCSPAVIELLNAFRTDVQQIAAGANAAIEGSVRLILVQSEPPEAPRGRYSEQQVERALSKFQEVIQGLGWSDDSEVKYLFLVRQMIARRLGFSPLQNLFTGKYASSKAQDHYESGEHYLLKPFVDFLCDLVKAQRNGNVSEILKILRKCSPMFDPQGRNAKRSISEMQKLSVEIVTRLCELWKEASIRDVLNFCQEKKLWEFSTRLSDELKRVPRVDEYDPSVHSDEKGEWLADSFFSMSTDSIERYVEFIRDHTVYSTQHGVKGEEYRRVVTVFDDTEAAWNNYSFAKVLTPRLSGDPTDGQYEKTTKLAYVCFSRAEVDLNIVLFTGNPDAAKSELIQRRLFEDDQIVVY